MLKDYCYDKVKLPEVVVELENSSGAEIRAVCTEAGYCAIRENRDYVVQDDFVSAIEKIRYEDEDAQELQKFYG